MKALDALEQYLSESAKDLDAKRPDEFTTQDYIDMMLTKHGRVIPSAAARYQLSKDVTSGKLTCRRFSFDGKFVNLYSAQTK